LAIARRRSVAASGKTNAKSVNARVRHNIVTLFDKEKQMATKTQKTMMQFNLVTLHCNNRDDIVGGIGVTVESIDTVLLPDADAARDLVDLLNTMYGDLYAVLKRGRGDDEFRWVQFQPVEHVVIADPRVMIERVEDFIDSKINSMAIVGGDLMDGRMLAEFEAWANANVVKPTQFEIWKAAYQAGQTAILQCFLLADAEVERLRAELAAAVQTLKRNGWGAQ
jgi:hypothetical protein